MKWTLILLLISQGIFSQDLSMHQWKNRLIVITADHQHETQSKVQLDSLQAYKQELIDRKLVLYHCVDNRCTYFDWKNKPQAVTFKTAPQGFQLKLIGLDGGTKFIADKVVEPKDLFALIDGMPMRKQEIKRKKKGND